MRASRWTASVAFDSVELNMRILPKPKQNVTRANVKAMDI